MSQIPLSRGIEKSLLRWAGGKTWLLKDLPYFLPSSFNNYHEPFLGGGSVFFYLSPQGQSYLCDINDDLINAFCQVRDNVQELIFTLGEFKNTKEEYYEIREMKFESPLEKAAQFIYLNRTCFNGIYRVNLQGEYNVPYGFKSYKNLFEFDRFRKSSKQLQSAYLNVGDFTTSLKNISEDDLVFVDPPYTVSHIKNGFLKYNEKLFSWKDQTRLADYIYEVKKKKAYYILTNAKHEAVDELFGKINKPFIVTRASVIGGKRATRGFVEEYIFTNIR